MSNTHKRRQKTSIPLVTILHRGAVPLFLFSLVLLILLVLSNMYVLPGLTSVDVGGKERDAAQLKSYYDSLLQQITEQEQERDALVLPMEDTAYRRLVEQKNAAFPLLSLRASLEQTAKQIAPEGKSVVHIDSIRYIPSKKRAELIGDVRNVGPRSMTVLAQLVEELRMQPFVEGIVSPRFQRREDPVLGMYSPFTLVISLP
ncbi:hypothetical protein COU78_00045 [Candidatus Peregrinibacteria bacterium CG10_big_fil_rev_8_21_14_0_10_49_24]|nr:MAG: hypothetical protein COV83_06090 [Candidatus Peregrinibacteria bacterium CG11_big_fil_rev_8_21_14_0_20_49_14]PIR51579.1 MAG: hypothetical protein COU78_00045 [Candidatus Peregrinibacteria bacterium CG10_big_fil_rev_8_21_14_0_10_49_24]PJA68059.1 MAG: hypothetical protein CO157_01920 [Candidatus Peregrinibacteria bacterium CG_4_9_14_3_um_filter_49_12]